MRLVLDLTGGPGDRIEGTATWDAHTHPVPFGGVLELTGLLEAALRDGQDSPNATPAAHPGGGPSGSR